MLRAQPKDLDIKSAAHRVMADAYRKACGDGRYPANARQVMYAARPLILELTGGKIWRTDQYFTQTLLPDYVREHPTQTASWDVVFDARGHFVEPHTGRSVDLGTLAVRRYVGFWDDTIDEQPTPSLPIRCDTSGPANRFRYALFLEKEGLTEILNAAQIAARFDLAIFSTKGMSNTAARTLVERLSEQGVVVLVARDFDGSGFTIAHTLANDTRRYAFRDRPKVVDLGLRLADAQAMGLQSEPVAYGKRKDPRGHLRSCGATDEEIACLVGQRDRWTGEWAGQRVELNAMTSPQLIAWLEAKLAEIGVRKLVPEQDVLERAYRRAIFIDRIERAVEEATRALENDELAVPEDLAERARALLEGTVQSWDWAVWKIAKGVEW
jgi:hypothetical protein